MAWPKDVRKGDLEITTYRGSGPGGQHRNKTDSAVRIKHKPTGKVASSETHKSQHQNKAEAFRRLASMLAPIMVEAASTEVPEAPTRVIRTYNYKRGTVKDYRCDFTVNLKAMLEGKALDDLLMEIRAREAACPSE